MPKHEIGPNEESSILKGTASGGGASEPVSAAEVARTDAMARDANDSSAMVAEAARAAEEFVIRCGPQPGSALAKYLERTHGFSAKRVGYSSLSEFLFKHVPRLRIAGRTGMDVVWTILAPPPLTAVESPTASGDQIWRAIASPNSNRFVQALVHTGSGRWYLSQLNDTGQSRPTAGTRETVEGVDGTWRKIEPLTREAHVALAERFAGSGAAGPLGERLGSMLQSPHWWVDWLKALSDHPETHHKWMTTRNEALVAHIRSALIAAGLEGMALERAASEPRHVVPPAGRRVRPAQSPASPPAPSMLGANSITLLRELASATLTHMTESELRDLRLPLGSLFDAVRRGWPSHS